MNMLRAVVTIAFLATTVSVAASADDALRRDWLFQAAGQSLGERTRAEIDRERALAKAHDLTIELTELATLDQRQAVAAGTFYSADVYEGVPDLPRGMAKSVRVWQQLYTTFSEARRCSAGPAPTSRASNASPFSRV